MCRLFRDRKQTGGETSNSRQKMVWSFRTTSFLKTVSGKQLGSIRETDCFFSLIVRVLSTVASCNRNDLRQNSRNPWEVMFGQEFSTYSSTGIIFHRDIHRLESKLAFIASLIGTNESIPKSKSSGKWLIISEDVTSSVPNIAADIASKNKKDLKLEWRLEKENIVGYEGELKP